MIVFGLSKGEVFDFLQLGTELLFGQKFDESFRLKVQVCKWMTILRQ